MNIPVIPYNNSQLRYWLALLRTPGIGPAKFQRILKIFPDLSELFQAPLKTLQNLGFSLLDKAGWQNVDKDLAWLAVNPHHFIITLQDPHYPELLRQIPIPPPLLFVKGDRLLLSKFQLAMVGSRNPTATGLENAKEFAKQLAAADCVITSGLALGIDAASHLGAVTAKGQTIAVMGTDIEQIYPKKHKNLSLSILENGGTLISEFPLGTNACPENFPRRNRIISGLSQGVLVVEATVRSGSLITAQLANEQGRDVFAIPGSIRNPLARGCHLLIQQGAKLVESVTDILEEYPAWYNKEKEYLRAKIPSQATKPHLGFTLDASYQKLLKCLDSEPVPIDVLVERSGLAVNNLSSMLLMLELNGYVQNNGGYRKIKL